VVGCGSSGADDLFSGGNSGQSGTSGSFGSGGRAGSSGFSGTSGTGGGTGGGSFGAGGVGGAGATGGTGGSSGNCNFDGAWAAFVKIPVTWPGSGVLEPGSGEIHVWLLTKRTLQGFESADTGRLCGVQLPPFQGTAIAGGEKYGIRFLADAFNNMPEFTFASNLHGLEPGATFSTKPAAIMFGMSMPNPQTDPWPPLAEVQALAEDHDNDGRPGLTGQTERLPGYFGPPVDLAKVGRAKELSLASRTVTQLIGAIKTCDELDGQVAINQIAGEPAIDSRIIGCVLESGATCDPTQVSFADSNGPNLRPSGGSTLVQRRVADTTNCAEVRGMFQ